MGQIRNFLFTVIVLAILVLGSVFEEYIIPEVESQLPTTLKITKLTAGGYDTFQYSITGPTSYATSIFTDIFVGSETVDYMGTDGPNPVDPGTYTIQETITIGWQLVNAYCNDGFSSFSVDTISDIVIDPGDNIECTFENVIESTDFDSDGIDNIIDILRDTPSDDYSDLDFGGTSFGTIITRGDQILTLSDNQNPSGIIITAPPVGGLLPAIMNSCGGISLITLNSGNEVVVTCGSVTVEVTSGPVDITFIGSGGTQGTTSIEAGNSITFDPDTFSFVVPLTNTQTIIIDVEGTLITLEPGSVISFSFLKITKLTTGGDDTFDFTVTGPTLYNSSITTGSGGFITYLDTTIYDIDDVADFLTKTSTIKAGQLMTFSSTQTITQVTLSHVFTDMAVNTTGQVYGVIYSGVSNGSSSFNVLGTSQVFEAPWDDDGCGGTNWQTTHDVCFIFDPPVTVNGSDIFVGFVSTADQVGDFETQVVSVDIGGNEGTCIEQDDDIDAEFHIDRKCTDHPVADFLMKIKTLSEGGIGIDGPTIIEPGTYSIQETIPAGWNLTSATCNDGSSSFNVDTVSGIVIDSSVNIECTFENEFVGTVSDTDDDGIFDEVDVLPNTVSDDFSDVSLGGTSSGTITTRGDQILAITEESNPDGVRITADVSGGLLPAVVNVCAGISIITLSPGDNIVVTCGSVTIDVSNGPVEVTFIGTGEIEATSSLTAGNSITFDSDTFSFVVPPTNSDPVVIIVDGEQVILNPGQAANVLSSDMDSFIKQGESDTNEGASTMMRVRDNGNNRALISFDQDSIQYISQEKTLSSATLRLYIEHNGNNWGPNGRTIDVHKLLEEWTEGDGFNDKPTAMSSSQFDELKNRGNGNGVTWRCATDAEINNQQTNCDTQWDGATFSAMPTDTVTIFKDNSPTSTVKTVGWIEFDVTSDLQAFLSTEQNYGWIVKKTEEGATGLVEFTSGESASNMPELVLVFG